MSNFADLISTDLAAFPAGSYAHTTLRPQYAVFLVGTVDDPVVGGDGLMAYAINDVNQQLVLMQPDGTASMPRGTYRPATPTRLSRPTTRRSSSSTSERCRAISSTSPTATSSSGPRRWRVSSVLPRRCRRS